MVLLTLFPLFLLLLARRATSTVRLCVFYFYRLIGNPFFVTPGVEVPEHNRPPENNSPVDSFLAISP
jgi:hypothetical protein